MARFIIKRVLMVIPILFVASVLIFLMVRLAPGDPVTALVGTHKLSDESRLALVQQFHLDKSLPEQYVIWISGLVQGDFPQSFKYHQPINELLASRLPTTLQLVLMSFSFAVVFSLLIGIIAALYKNSLIDRVLSTLLVLLASTPNFLLAIVFILVFALTLQWFPSFGAGRGFVDNFRYLTLPAIALGAGMLALTGRITRAQMISELREDYARTETAKGTPRWRIVLSHCLKSAIIPVLTVSGMELGGMIVGAVMVERVFALGGVGELLVEGIGNVDYPMTQTIIILMIAVFLIINLIVDIVYSLIDPRIRYEKKAAQ